MTEKKNPFLLWPRLVAFCGWLLAVVALFAPSTHADDALAQNGSITMPLYKSQVITLDRPASRVSVGSPDIADILIFRSRQLYILGKDIGTTNVLLWDANDQLIRSLDVQITHDLDVLKSLLHRLLPQETIAVHSAQRSIVLTGEVSNMVSMQSALTIAKSFLQQVATAKSKQMFEQESVSTLDKTAGEVINLMTVGGNHQVMLSITVAEIARTELKRLNTRLNAIHNRSGRWQLGGAAGGATFPDALFQPNDVRVPVFGDASGDTAVIGPVIDEFLPDPARIEDSGLFASFLTDNFLMTVVLDAAKEKGLARILAEPTLTTQSGQEAEFLSGGEFPIPVPQARDTITIHFKEFGVGVKFLPVVLGTGQINLKINVSVSDLVSSNAVTFQPTEVSSGFFVPSLSKRSASTTVELGHGQTIGIAGLINENLREVMNNFPGLGNLPIIGHLFRSQEFIKGETELVILVTPRLAVPVERDKLRLPTDDFVEPTDAEFYLMGRLEGSRPANTETGAEGGTQGRYGHVVD